MLRGNTLNEHPFIGGAIFPRGRGLDVLEFTLAQCLADLAQGGFLGLCFHDKIRKAGNVMGIRTDEFGHNYPGLKVESAQAATVCSQAEVLMVLILWAVMKA